MRTPKLTLPILLAALLLASPALAQETDSVRTVVDEMPELLPDNATAFAAMSKEMKYPESAKEAGAEGRVLVQFVVDEKGEVTDPEITKGAHEALDAEALRVAETLLFKPGRQGGEPVAVKLTLPFTFKLPADTTDTAPSFLQAPADTTGTPPGQ